MKQKDLVRQALSLDSLTYLNKQSFKWLLISMLVFFAADYYKIDRDSCQICYSASSCLGFIEPIATASKFEEGFRLQWLFLFVSMPAYITFIVTKINDVKHGDIRLKLLVISTLVSCFTIYVFVFSEVNGNRNLTDLSHGRTAAFLNNPIVASFGSFFLFYAISLTLIFIGLYLKAYFKHKRELKHE